MQWFLIVARSLVKDLQEKPLQLYLTFLSKFIIVIVLDSMHIFHYEDFISKWYFGQLHMGQVQVKEQ